MRRGRSGGFGGGGGVERKWKRVAEKGDNEGRDKQIGQNKILVGRFANMEQTYFALRSQTGLNLLLIISK